MTVPDSHTVALVIGTCGLLSALPLWLAFRPMNRLFQALILLGVFDCIILISIPFLNNIYSGTTLTFDGKMTFSDGKLTFVINNNNQSLLKYLNIYGMDKNNPIIVRAQMTDALGNIQQYLTFTDGKTQLAITKVAGDPQKIDLQVNIPSGLFQGWIIISGKNPTSIPITVATNPMTVEAVGWIVVGILTSIINWEVILYYKPAKPGIQEAAAEAAEEVAKEAHNRGPGSKADDGAREKSDEISQRPTIAAEVYKTLYVNSRFPTRTRAPIPSAHLVLLDIITIIFGIGVGLLALFSQGYVNQLHVIGAWDIVALLGLGLGIGSLHSQS